MFNQIKLFLTARIRTTQTAIDAEEMRIVNTWCNETEVLLDEYDEYDKLQDLNVGYKAGPPQETGEQEVKTESKKEKRARLKEEKSTLREHMIQHIEKLSVSK